jgi:hypothetical protein
VNPGIETESLSEHQTVTFCAVGTTRRCPMSGLVAALIAASVAPLAGCHSSPRCRQPEVPVAGSSGSVAVTYRANAGGSLQADFGGREWASPDRTASATTRESGDAVVVSGAHGPELSVTRAQAPRFTCRYVKAACS